MKGFGEKHKPKKKANKKTYIHKDCCERLKIDIKGEGYRNNKDQKTCVKSVKSYSL